MDHDSDGLFEPMDDGGDHDDDYDPDSEMHKSVKHLCTQN